MKKQIVIFLMALFGISVYAQDYPLTPVDMRAWTDESNVHKVLQDKATQSLLISTTFENMSNDGLSFQIMHSDTGMAIGDTFNIYFKTPNTDVRIHCNVQWTSSGASYFKILENPYIDDSTGTNNLVPVNLNRYLATVSTIRDNDSVVGSNLYARNVVIDSLYSDPIFIELSGGAHTVVSNDWYILKKNTGYVFQAESLSTDDGIGLIIRYYELEHKN